MRKNTVIRIVPLFLAALFCLPVLTGSAEELSVSRDVFDTYGIEPILPLEGEIDIASIDYYYEEQNDALPGLHGGVDMICAANTPVMAVYGGEVCLAEWSDSYGNTIVLRHTSSAGGVFYSRYAHLASYPVTEGDQVGQGDVIGYAGSTGQSYVNHLHLEIYTSDFPDKYERSYTTKYLLSLGVTELSRMSFYYHPVSGEYNSQPRVNTLGSGGSCRSRCGLYVEHDHISNYAEYIKAFYSRSAYSWDCRYYYNYSAEASLFSDAALREYVYDNFDLDRDGHLSYFEAMSVTTLDLRGLGVRALDGIDIFENLTTVLTSDEDADEDTGTDADPSYRLNITYKLAHEYTNSAGYLGLWKHVDTVGGLNMRQGPSTSYSRVGSIPPLATFRVTDTSWCGTYMWGKTVYNGVEGWCVIANSWTSQLTSGRGEYTIDSDGYLIYTESGERVVTELNCDSVGAELFDGAQIDFITEGYEFGGWSPDGYHVIYGNTALFEYFSGTGEEDVNATVEFYPASGGDAGDVDGDGNIDEQDIHSLVRYISGYRDSGLSADLFDANSDGKVNNRDLIMIREQLKARQ